MLAAVGGLASTGQIFTSTDSGVNWIARDDFRYWQCVASSADGANLVAFENKSLIGGLPYTSTDSGVTWSPQGVTVPFPDGYLQGGQNSAIELQYIGNNQFLPLSYLGNIISF